MRAAEAFASGLGASGQLNNVARVEANLYGSLALTGRGHATDRAILLGLSGELPDEVDPEQIEFLVADIRGERSLLLGGSHRIRFDESADLLFHKDAALPAHPNGMSFHAFDETGNELVSGVYYSIGGGFIKTHGEMGNKNPPTFDFKHAFPPRKVPHPFKS